MKTLISKVFALTTLVVVIGAVSAALYPKQAQAIKFKTCIFNHNGVQYAQKIVSFADCNTLPIPNPDQHVAVSSNQYVYMGTASHEGSGPIPPNTPQQYRPHCIVDVFSAGEEDLEW